MKRVKKVLNVSPKEEPSFNICLWQHTSCLWQHTSYKTRKTYPDFCLHSYASEAHKKVSDPTYQPLRSGRI